LSGYRPSHYRVGSQFNLSPCQKPWPIITSWEKAVIERSGLSHE
jgi:hypothetical protein